MPCLAVSLRFHEGRYHGRVQGGTDWPPSPARLFQALVAGTAQGETLAEEDKLAFEWLESLPPPVIAAPSMRVGQSVRNFVPNNDIDAVGGESTRVGEIRTPKLIRPILFEADTPLVYLWTFGDNPAAKANAKRVCLIAQWLYQLGRGLDMAWACGEVIAAHEAEARLSKHRCVFYRPGNTTGGINLAVPIKGSLDSIVARHKERRERFRTLYESKPNRRGPEQRIAVGQVLLQPRRPRFGQVPYDGPPKYSVFDLVGPDAPWRLDRVVELTERVRDGAAVRLKEAWSAKAACVERVLIGRNATEADKAARVRIVPLPSIGHPHADHAIRRILIEIPANCPLRADDLEWAFSGLSVCVSEQGEILCELVPAADDRMLAHYGIQAATAARRWRTVTPAALPESAARRRIDPNRLRDPAEAKQATERTEEEKRAAGAAVQALRHVGVAASATQIRVQREPFTGKGRRVEDFAAGTRFGKERLWHVEITFSQPVAGPLIFGDGRYLGLGLMEPTSDTWHDLMVFKMSESSRVSMDDRTPFLQAIRRALMALARRGDDTVPRLFSGHEFDGAPARSGRHEHTFLAAADSDSDGFIDRVIVAAPWRCDRSVRPGRGDPALFDRVVSSLEVVRAGRLGVMTLKAAADGADEIGVTGPARTWHSHTQYSATRPARQDDDPADVLRRDAVAECRRRGLPQPHVEVLDHSVGTDGRTDAGLLLHFAVAVAGPLLLGRDSHQGGGFFLAKR